MSNGLDMRRKENKTNKTSDSTPQRKKMLLPNTRSSLMFLMQNQRPAGNVHTRMWRSKKKETHVVGWCSDTDAMMGMWILA